MAYQAIIKGKNRASLRGSFDQIAPDSETLSLLKSLLESETYSDPVVKHERLRDLYRKFVKILILGGAPVGPQMADDLGFPRRCEDLTAIQAAFIVWVYKIGQPPSPHRISFETITNCHDSLLYWNHEFYVKRKQPVDGPLPTAELVSDKIIEAIGSAFPWPKQIAKRTLLANTTSLSSADKPLTEEEVIREKIRNCLARANHPNTPEVEARTSLFMARRLMAQHNVSQADTIAEACESGAAADLGGESIVTVVRSRGKNIKVLTFAWVEGLAAATAIFFNCASYHVQYKSSVKWVFYGIAANTVSAATSFEMLHNLAQEWNEARKHGSKRDYLIGFSQKITDMAKAERRKEEDMAKSKEAEGLLHETADGKRQHQEELERLGKLARDSSLDPKSSLPQRLIPDSEESDSEDYLSDDSDDRDDSSDGNDTDELDTSEDSDLFYDSDDSDDNDDNDSSSEDEFTDEEDEDTKTAKTSPTRKRKRSHSSKCNSATKKPKSSSPDESSAAEPYQWERTTALELFRKSARQVETEYLAARGKSLRKGAKRSWAIRDRRAYRQGRKDARAVDVRGASRKRLG